MSVLRRENIFVPVNLFPLHLMPQDAFFERDGAALKLKPGAGWSCPRSLWGTGPW